MKNYFENCFTLDDIYNTCSGIVENYYRNVYGADGDKILSDMWNEFESAVARISQNMQIL